MSSFAYFCVNLILNKKELTILKATDNDKKQPK